MMKSTHPAVVTTAPRAPLSIVQVSTPSPTGNEVLVENLWTASTPLDLHQADGGIALPGWPARLGDGVAGPVVATGRSTKLQLGDLVFGFTWRNPEEKAYQNFVLAPENLLAKVPAGWENRLQELVTVPNNFVTAWHAFVTDLGISLPWPKPEEGSSTELVSDKNKRILIWGGSSSCGQYALQILRDYGYRNVVATASPRNFELVKECGAAHVVNYGSKTVSEDIKQATGGKVELVLDCIGSLEGSVRPIAGVVEEGAKVAILLPVIVRDATEEVEPIYEMDVKKTAAWSTGVEVRGVRTHFYLDNEFHAKHLQSEIMPALVEKGIVKPNKQKIVEGKTLLERAQNALDALRRKEVSGERLVWRVSEK